MQARRMIGLNELINRIDTGNFTAGSEFELTEKLGAYSLTRINGALKRRSNQKLLYLIYSLNDTSSKTPQSKAALDLLNGYLLINRLSQHDARILKKYGDDQSKLNLPLEDYSGQKFQNALHFYLVFLQRSLKAQEVLTDQHYEIINYLLDNKVQLTSESEKKFHSLIENNSLWIYRLRFKENGYITNPIVSNIIRFEKEKILSESIRSKILFDSLVNRIIQDDVRLLINYGDGQHNLSLPLVDHSSGMEFDNALHFYLAHVQKNTPGKKIVSSEPYEVIDYLLDNQVPITTSSEKIIYDLIEANKLWVHSLRLEENGYANQAKDILSYEKHKVTKKGKKALDEYLLAGHLYKSDIAGLKEHSSELNHPLKYITATYDNALHFYLSMIDDKAISVTDAEYEVINFLLDNKVAITPAVQQKISVLVRWGVLSTYQLRLSENDYKKSYHLAESEIAKVIGNTFGLLGKVNIAGPYDSNKKEIQFEGMYPHPAMPRLLKALEAFIASDTFKSRFSQYEKQMQEVLAILRENFILNTQYKFDSTDTKIETMMSRLVQGKPICLFWAGSKNHCAPVIVIHKIISCNKGNGRQANKVAVHYQLPRKKLYSILSNLIMADTKETIDEYVDCFKNLKEIDSTTGKGQKTGNCSVAGNRVLCHELMKLLINDPVVDEINKVFGAFQRTFELQEFCHSPIVKDDKLFAFNVLTTILRFQHDASKEDERLRIESIKAELKTLFKEDVVIKELSAKHYPLNLDDFMSMLDRSKTTMENKMRNDQRFFSGPTNHRSETERKISSRLAF